MRRWSALGGVCFSLCFLAVQAAGQVGGVAVSGPSPWVDPTSPLYGAKCNGSTDDTPAIQNALTAIATVGGGTLFIPPTASGCQINGYSQVILGASIANVAMCGGGFCEVTITFSSSPSAGFVAPTGLVNIHGVGNGTNTIFNGTYVVTIKGRADSNGDCVSSGGNGAFCIGYEVPGSGTDSGSVTGSSIAEIGLYYNGNNLKIIGGTEGQGSGIPSGSMLVTCSACTTNITILTTMTSANPQSGPDIQNITFYDKSSNAYAGLNIATTNAFNVSNDGFYGFSATGSGSAVVAADPQGGAAIVTTGGQKTSVIANPWVQFGKIENNHINAKIGFTSKFKLSSVTFDSNTVQCPSLVTNIPTQGMIGLDIGGLWYLNTGATSTGGENRVINQQTQGCLIGVLLGSQNNDRVEEKLENGGSPSSCNNGTSVYCSIGMALLNTLDSTLYQQSKFVSSGLYIDPSSTNNTIYENATGNPQSGSSSSASGATLNTLCPLTGCLGSVSAYSFSTASLVIDPSAPAIAAGTSIFGTPSGGSFAPTSNSTFTTDNAPSGLNVTVAGTNVGLAVTGDGSGVSDVLEVNTHGHSSGNALKVSTGGATTLGTPLGVASGGTGVAAAQGNGSLVQLSTGSTTSGDCVKFDANGNTADYGLPCNLSLSTGGAGGFWGVFVNEPPNANLVGLAAASNNQVVVYQFVLSWTVVIGHIDYNINTQATGNFDAGIYDSGGSLKLHLGATTTNQTAGNYQGAIPGGAVTLNPGVYFLAWGADNTSFKIGGVPVNTNLNSLLNLGSAKRVGTCGSGLSSGALQSPCGTISATSPTSIPALFFES